MPYNTNNTVPSSDLRDFWDNSQNLDFALNTITALVWSDRAGKPRSTWYGIEQKAQQVISDIIDDGQNAIAGLGYITVDSFQDSATITQHNQVLRWKLPDGDGEYYRWDGVFSVGGKIIPPGSTPLTTGGIGTGKWLSVGDASLRTEINRGQFKYEDAESVFYVPNIDFDISVDNRNACYSFPSKIYVPINVTLRVNLLPDDDVRKFIGEGKLIVRNQFYNDDIVFDINQATNGNGKSVKDTLLEAIRLQTQISIGVVGDSITDGAWGKQNWTSPPLDANRNLSAPITYNHYNAGGSHSWVSHWQWLMNMVQSRYSADPIFQIYNASLSGAKLSDGWGYRNFDYGFFGNAAYGSKAPGVCILAMGWNDINQDVNTYRDQIDMFVRKAWGYGCVVGIVTVNNNNPQRMGFEAGTKRQMSKELGVDYFNLGETLTVMSNESMASIPYYYVKKEPQYDTTHPQELGQMAMGDAMFMQTLGDRYVRRVQSGDIINTSVVENYWDAVTLSSKTHLTPRYGASSGTGKLNTFGYLPLVDTLGESVAFTSFVWCDSDGMSLTVLEPWGNTGTAVDENTLLVRAPAGRDLDESDATYGVHNQKINAYRQFCSGKLASTYFGGARTLTTYGGQLRRGLNQITVTNGSKLARCWYPALKFGSVITDGIRLPLTRVNVVQSAAPVAFSQDVSQLDDYVLSSVMTGRASSRTPDGFIRQGSLVGRVTVKSGLPLDCYLALNWDVLLNKAIIIGVAADGRIAAAGWDSGENGWRYFGDVSVSTFANIGFSIWVYTTPATGVYTFTVVTDDGRVNTQVITTAIATSGVIGTYKKSTGSVFLEMDANFSLIYQSS